MDAILVFICSFFFSYAGSFEGSNYYVSESSYDSWNQANQLASGVDQGHLLTISSIDEQEYIQSNILAGNSNKVYLGVSDVTASNGYELSAGNEIEINFGDQGGTVPFSVFYVDAATNNDKVSWVVILDG